MKLDRRTLLRGAGASLALPLFEAMLDGHGEALADGTALPVRFGVFWFGNGVNLNRWVPSATGNDWPLSEQLSPLRDQAAGVDVKNYVSVASGFALKTPDYRGHHNGCAALMSGAPIIPLPPGAAPYASKFSRRTVDHVLGDLIGGSTAFKTLQLAVSKRANTEQGPTLLTISHAGPDAPVTPISEPAVLFDKLFGAGTTGLPPNDPQARLRASVLDKVSGDAKRLQARLGSADRARLDAHLTAVSELRQRILTMASMSQGCTVPLRPTQLNADVDGIEPMEAVSATLSDILALAWACDLNRVATFQFSGSSGNQCYKQLTPGQPRDVEHNITHDGSQQDKVHQAVLFTMRCFARHLEAFRRTTEGQGNLLDTSSIVCATDVSEGVTHGTTDIPILLAGKARGALKAGVHVRSQSLANTSDVVLTAMKATGAALTSFGEAQGLSSTTVSDLLT
jgi:hypothetical protein